MGAIAYNLVRLQTQHVAQRAEARKIRKSDLTTGEIWSARLRLQIPDESEPCCPAETLRL